MSDWVYEEEFDLRDGFRWSPDGTKIAYWHFDMTGVRTFTLINNTDSLYPYTIPIQYPKAGTPNSAVTADAAGAGGRPPPQSPRSAAAPADQPLPFGIGGVRRTASEHARPSPCI